jgi:glycerophosphoryl diester phosphodiesterase
MKARQDIRSLSGFLCFAHRGASGHEPENTLGAIEKAISMGASWIEIDVHAVEGELVVIHDERLEATTNGKGPVTKQSLAYLRSLDAGKGQRIPLLREVFELIADRAGINVELKGSGTAGPVVNLIDEYKKHHPLSYGQVLLSSFRRRELTRVRALNPEIPLGVLARDILRSHTGFARALGAVSLHVHHTAVRPALVDDAHRRGLKVFAYTLNDPGDLQRMRALGVDGVFTDYPELVLSGNDPSA